MAITPIDNYCERTGPEFWSEPLNAVTNLAFVAAGLWGLAQVRKHGTGLFAQVLCWWAIVIGVGSFLFHTTANSLTVWADVLPIVGFVFAYTLFNLRRFFRFSWAVTIAVFVAFYAVAGLITWLVPASIVQMTSGTTGYLPAFLAMFFFGGWLTLRGHPAGPYDLAAGAIFVVSVTFRAIDSHVCETLPIGTHFLWHSLNGLMLAVLLTAAAKFGHPQPRHVA
jgi:hypothetical protein